MDATKVFGPPGSGKTTFLLNVVDIELRDGTHPTKIGYFAFTRKAATEAKDRAIEKFPDLNGDLDFPWFRTLHSLAYRCLGIGNRDMMSPQHYAEFAKEAGIELAVEQGEEEFAIKADHPILNEVNIARIKGKDLRQHYNESGMTIEWHHFEYVDRAYRHYKASHGLLDFTDLLERVVDEPERLPSLKGIMAAKKKPVETLTIADIGLEPAAVGLGAAWSQVAEFAARPPKAAGTVVADDGQGGSLIADFLVEQKFL